MAEMRVAPILPAGFFDRQRRQDQGKGRKVGKKRPTNRKLPEPFAELDCGQKTVGTKIDISC